MTDLDKTLEVPARPVPKEWLSKDERDQGYYMLPLAVINQLQRAVREHQSCQKPDPEWRCVVSQTLWPADWAKKCDRIYTDDDDHSMCHWVRVTRVDAALSGDSPT